MKFYLISLIILISQIVHADSIKQRILELGLVESERNGLYKQHEAGFRSFYVSKKDGAIIIREPPLKHVRAFPPVFTSNTGKYLGTNKGEWGGDLSYESNKNEKETLLNANIYSLIPRGDGLLVLVGTGILDVGGGALFEIEDINNPTKPKLLTLLPDAPIETIELEQDSELIVFGNNTITNISLGLKIKAFEPWKGIRLTSAVQVNKDIVLVGLVSGLAIVNIDIRNQSVNYKVKVYVPPEHKL